MEMGDIEIYSECDYCGVHYGELQNNKSYMCDECYERYSKRQIMKIEESLDIIRKWLCEIIRRRRMLVISSYCIEEQNEDICVWCRRREREYKRLCYDCDYKYEKMNKERY